MSRLNRPFPIFGILSIVMTPIAVLTGILAAVFAEGVLGIPGASGRLDGLARVLVFFMTICVAAGLVSVPISLIRRERLPWLPFIGAALTIISIVLFDYGAGGN